MSTISVRLPDSLHQMAKTIAADDHISMNQLIISAVAEKVAALAAVPDQEPEDFDKLK